MKINPVSLGLAVMFLVSCTASPGTIDLKPSKSSDSGTKMSVMSPAPNPSEPIPVIMPEEISSDEGIAIPSNISGSYLFCEVVDGGIKADNSAQVGCWASSSISAKKLDLKTEFSAAAFAYQQPSDGSVKVEEAIADESSKFHVTFNISDIDSALTLDVVKKMMVMFKGNPIDAQGPEYVFSARLVEEQAANSLLPEDFLIYYNNGTVINQPIPGFEARVLPTVNSTYPKIDGCYVACFSNSSAGSVYGISLGGEDPTKQIYVMGQVRVKGKYNGRVCEGPSEAETAAACGKHIPSCAGDICWGGGDTGGFFGL